MLTKTTSGPSNLTKRPHCHSAWMVQRYSPGGASVHAHVTHGSLGPPEYKTQMGSHPVQPFFHSSRHGHSVARHVLSP